MDQQESHGALIDFLSMHERLGRVPRVGKRGAWRALGSVYTLFQTCLCLRLVLAVEGVEDTDRDMLSAGSSMGKR